MYANIERQSVPVFGNEPKSMFNNNGFKNPGDLLHNNLADIMMHEEIKEYSITIDSKDRNYQIYTDPFYYEVKFAPSMPTNSGEKSTYDDPSPYINGTFTNVRYVYLDVAILPYYNRIKCESDVCDELEHWKINTDFVISDNLYTVLNVGSLADENYYSTNDLVSNSFAVLYFKEEVSKTHYRAFSTNGIKIFPSDSLGKINKLKINFLDNYGSPISCHHLDKTLPFNCACTCDDGKEENTCFMHNLFHPLNPIFQHHIQLKIGVVEPRMSKKTFC
jgi:hypothetical protein